MTGLRTWRAIRKSVGAALCLAAMGAVRARAEEAPHTAAAMLHLVPADQRLTPVRIFLHGDWLTKAVFVGLLAVMAAALGVWIVQQVRLRRSPPQSPEVALAFLSAVVVTAPLLGLTRAAYETMKVCIGLVNLRPAVDIVMLAPAFAEASMSILLGVTAAAVAAAARGHILMTLHARRRGATRPRRRVRTFRHGGERQIKTVTIGR